VVSFYGGIRMKADEMTEAKDDFEANAYKIMDMLGPDADGREGILDIPPEFRSLVSSIFGQLQDQSDRPDELVKKSPKV
jgi:hypothetical protein